MAAGLQRRITRPLILRSDMRTVKLHVVERVCVRSLVAAALHFTASKCTLRRRGDVFVFFVGEVI